MNVCKCKLPIPVFLQSKAKFYGLLFAGIVGSNLAEGMDILFFLCRLRRTDNSFRGILPGGCESNCVWFQDLKTGRPGPSLCCSATEKPRNLAIFIHLMSQILIFIVIRLKVLTLHVTQHIFIQVKPKANVSERVKLNGWFESSCMRTDARYCYYYEVPNTVSKPTWQEHYPLAA